MSDMPHQEHEAQTQGQELGSCIHHEPVVALGEVPVSTCFSQRMTGEMLPSCARTCPGFPHRNRRVPPDCARTCFESLGTATRRRPTTNTEVTSGPRRCNPTGTSTAGMDVMTCQHGCSPLPKEEKLAQKCIGYSFHACPWTLQVLFFLTLSVTLVESGPMSALAFLTHACD